MATVLFVDDEQDVLDGLRRVFSDGDYTLRFARDYAEALWVLKAEHVDVVVSDDGLPGLEGSRLLRILRRTYPNIKRIMLTGRSTEDISQQALAQAEVFRYLTKPCPADEVRSAVFDALLAANAG